MKFSYHIFFLIFLLPLASHPQGLASDNEEYQKWADLCRITAVYRIAELSESYKKKIGLYPFQKMTNVPVEVRFSELPLEGNDLYPPAGVSGVVVEWRTFALLVEKVLGDQIPIQLAPKNQKGPGPYDKIQFYTDHLNYWVSANLYHATPNTRRLTDYDHKYEIGSLSVPEKKIRTFSLVPRSEIIEVRDSLKGKPPCPVGRLKSQKIKK